MAPFNSEGDSGDTTDTTPPEITLLGAHPFNIEDNAYTDGYLLGWSNSGFTETTIFYMDDFKLGTTADSIGFVIP